MKIFDITVPIKNSMPVWPGDPNVKNKLVSSIDDGDEANVTVLQMSAHTGTHIDAPRHFIKDGTAIEKLDLELFLGIVLVVQVPTSCNLIRKDTLLELGITKWPERVLFRTRNSDLRIFEDDKFHEDFVALSHDGAKYLVEQGVKLIGIDYLSIAPFENPNETHVELLINETIVLEGLNLTNIEPGKYELIALPILLKGADGAPARILLIEK